ncbi:hypothetical protein BDF20DRAFT_835750 [Mycotypha africana]|uniref:uncharacterized protein n=1 Tax=Mycotypha africana TaxID=64632 RepID=UPI002301356B|nr:uncharacterized protein BDF20DRAFT_835750 [Mycotypha africana]KAI8979781.1 hypothetical protein BDF20DRAFT_835750 [Mycotypha africana]
MATARLRSFLHTKRQEDTPSQFPIKRSTISFPSRQAFKENNNIDCQANIDSVKRSTTLSRVKRFGSLLTRNSSGRYKISTSFREEDTLTPFSLDFDASILTKPSSNITSRSSSHIVTNSINSDDSEEENLITPTQSTTSFFSSGSEKILVNNEDGNEGDTFTTEKIIQKQTKSFFTPIVTLTKAEQQQVFCGISSATTKIEIDQSLKSSIKETYFAAEVETEVVRMPTTVPQSVSDHNIAMSEVSLVRTELQLAFEMIDKKLEEELDSRHSQMSRNIYAKPIYTF